MDGLASQLEKFLYDIQSEPGMCAFQSTTVNAGTPGSKLGLLRALLEREADKLRGGEPTVKFAGNYNEHGLVALNSRLARDPAGKPTSETGSESYSKNVKTKYEPQSGLIKQATKKRRKKNVSYDSSSEEELAADVSAITTANIYQHVIAIVNQQAKASKGPCFKFARGACSDEHCKWSHDSSQQTTSRQENRQVPTGRERQQGESRRSRESSNNNFRQNHAGASRPTSTPFYQRDATRGSAPKSYEERNFTPRSEHANSSYRGGKGGKGKVIPSFQPPSGACSAMIKKGICTNSGCRDKHGAWTVGVPPCHHIADGTPCIFIWSSRGCRFAHKAKNA